MPAKSEAQRKLMAIAEHSPSKVHAANKGVLKMSHSQLHDFADTKGLRINHVHQHLGKGSKTGPHVTDVLRHKGHK